MLIHIYLWRIYSIFLIISQIDSYNVRNPEINTLLCAKAHKSVLSTDQKIDTLIGLDGKSKESSTTPILILRNASLWRKDRQILSNLNLQVNPGDRIGIVGNNGAGKSTLIKLIHSCVNNSPVSDALITCDQTVYRGDRIAKLQSKSGGERFYFILGIWLSMQIKNSHPSRQVIEDLIRDMEDLNFDQFYQNIINKVGDNLNLETCVISGNRVVYMHQDFKNELRMDNTLSTEIARFLQPVFIKERFSRFVSENIDSLQEIADKSDDLGVLDHVKSLLNTFNQNNLLINKQFIDYRNRTDKLIRIFDLDEYKNIQLGHLSSGLIVRSYILLSLLQNPDLMLLDEPTNNLDVKNSEFLAEALKQVVDNRKIGIITVSHDEIFLNRYSNIIWECPGDGSVEMVKGNYDRFIRYKNDRVKRIELRRNRLNILISKLSDKGGKSSTKDVNKPRRYVEKIAKYTKEMESLKVTRGPLELSKYSTIYSKSLQDDCDELFNERRFRSFHNNELFSRGIENKFVDGSLFEFRNYSISNNLNDHIEIISGYSFNIKASSNIAIMGGNGVGKSTLIKSIFGGLDKSFTVTGDFKQAKSNIRINYFPQLHVKLFDTPMEVMQLLLDVAKGTINLQGQLYYSLEGDYEYDVTSDNIEGDLKQIMVNFHIDDKISKSSISKCSSGEKSRVTLSLLFMRDCNLMILDEPTNHLDSFLKSYLVFLLNNIFKGNFIIISHDEDFLKRLNINSVLYLFNKNTIYSINKGKEFINEYYSRVYNPDFNLEEFLEGFGSKTVGESEIKMSCEGQRLADVLEKEEIQKESEMMRSIKRRASFGGNNVSNMPRIKNFNRWN